MTVWQAAAVVVLVLLEVVVVGRVAQLNLSTSWESLSRRALICSSKVWPRYVLS
jgi:hypothetical protein